MSKEDTKAKKFLEIVNETYGSGCVILPEMGGKFLDDIPEVISTGCKAIDDATGIGGFPFGKIVEILGQEASGKTTLALSVIAEAQKKGIACGYIDTEQALNKTRATELGVDFEKLFISQPDNGEQALNIMESMILSRHIRIVVIDSVAALTPKAEIEGEMNDASIGGLARMMGKAMRKNVAYINKLRVLVIFTNQIRSKIGGFGFGPQETTPGGNALKFYASMRIDCRRTGNNKSGERLVSTNHKITIKKNKFAPPFASVSVKIGKNGFQ